MQWLHEFNRGVNEVTRGINEVNRGVSHSVARQGCNLLRAAVTSAVTSQGCCCGNLQIHPLDLGHSPPRGTVSSLRLSHQRDEVSNAPGKGATSRESECDHSYNTIWAR